MSLSVREQKKEIRKAVLDKRKTLSLERRLRAAHQLFLSLTLKLKPFARVLSFVSCGTEIDLWPLNRHLAEEKKLVLLRMGEKERLLPYFVSQIERDLVKAKNSNILEPNQVLCQALLEDKIECALIPAIAFDKSGNRLGYGKGYYDRLLPKLSCPLWGVGFQEQLLDRTLPTESFDVKVEDLVLF